MCLQFSHCMDCCKQKVGYLGIETRSAILTSRTTCNGRRVSLRVKASELQEAKDAADKLLERQPAGVVMVVGGRLSF
jgi:hypothetical protein